MSRCFICNNFLGNTYSLKVNKSNKGNKDDEYVHTCSYKCNMEMTEKYEGDFWKDVKNKSDFINPFNSGNPFIHKEKVIKNNYEFYDFENMDENSDLMMDGERYERLYKIYLENKHIDEILDASDSDSNSDYSDDY